MSSEAPIAEHTHAGFLLTPNAVAQIRKIKSAGQPAEANLRVKVVGGGCSGFSYKMDFDSKLGDYDKTFDFDDVRVVIDPKSYLYLQNVELDFDDSLGGKGFVYSNPDAKRTCGCGSSFGV